MRRRKTNDDRQSIDEMAERVLTTSEVGDDRTGQRNEPLDSDERAHAAHAKRHSSHLKIDSF